MRKGIYLYLKVDSVNCLVIDTCLTARTLAKLFPVRREYSRYGLSLQMPGANYMGGKRQVKRCSTTMINEND